MCCLLLAIGIALEFQHAQAASYLAPTRHFKTFGFAVEGPYTNNAAELLGGWCGGTAGPGYYIAGVWRIRENGNITNAEIPARFDNRWGQLDGREIWCQKISTENWEFTNRMYRRERYCPSGGTLSGDMAFNVPIQCVNAPDCPSGQAYNRDGICAVPVADVPKNVGACDLCIKNPINPSIGNKFQSEIDYRGEGPFPLQFSRFYNSDPTQLTTTFNSASTNNKIGLLWRSYYDRKIGFDGQDTVAIRPDGKRLKFIGGGGGMTVLVPSADVIDRLQMVVNPSNGVHTGWKYTASANDTVENYDVNGRLNSIVNREGLSQSLAYNGNGQLTTVTDSFGRTLVFTYDGSSRVSTMTDPNGGVYQYGYDSNNNLSAVTYPDSTVRTYHYENTSFANALTGITDESASRFSNYQYDSQGRATSTARAGGAEQATVSYGVNSATVTDTLGATLNYDFSVAVNVAKRSGTTQPNGAGTGTASDARTFDANGNVSSATDFNGNRTNYTYDLARNLETSRVEGLTSTGGTTATTRDLPPLAIPIVWQEVRLQG